MLVVLGYVSCSLTGAAGVIQVSTCCHCSSHICLLLVSCPSVAPLFRVIIVTNSASFQLRDLCYSVVSALYLALTDVHLRMSWRPYWKKLFSDAWFCVIIV